MYTYNEDGELLENGMWIDYCDVADILNSLEGRLSITEAQNKHLETKLAESKEEIKVIDEDRQFKAEMWTKFANKCKELEKQLAEKEKERHEEWKTGKEWKWEWQKVNQKLEQANQDKISFCIEQLEKVRKFAEDMWGIYKAEEDIEEFIKDQIKQLKDMK